MKMEKKTFSITIRPRLDNFGSEAWIQVLKEKYSKCKFIWAREGGEEGGFNHIQGMVEKASNPSNLKREIQGYLQFVPEDEDETRSWWTCKACKTELDILYLTGYCQKEKDFVTNLGGVNLQLGDEHYNNTRVKGERNFGWQCTSINSLLPFAKLWWQKYCQEEAIKTGSDRIKIAHGESWVDNGDGRTHCDLMVYKDYPTLQTVCQMMVKAEAIPFSLGRKVKSKTDEVYWVNIMEELSVSDLNMRNCRIMSS